MLACADVENQAGELLVVHARHQLLPPGWARSGAQLDVALRGVSTTPEFVKLCDDIVNLWSWRNFLMHGDWAFHPDATASVVLRRHVKKDKQEGVPEWDVSPILTLGTLDDLIAQALDIRERLLQTTMDVMGGIVEPG